MFNRSEAVGIQAFWNSRNGMATLSVILMCFGVAYSSALLVFNIWYRNLRFIKMTSPRINNIVMLGSLVLYTFSLLAGLEFSSPIANQVNQQIEYWVLTIGFTLMFGSMLVKGWRVRRLFRYQKKTHKQLLRDGNLMVGLLTFLVMDVSLMLGWQLSDPVICMHQNPVYCMSAQMSLWLLVLSLYKQVGLIVCCYIGWSIRHVNLPCLDDGRSLILSCGLTLFCCGLFANVLCLYPLSSSVILHIVSLLTWSLTTLTLSINFLPKVYIIWKSRGEDPYVSSASKCIQPPMSNNITQEVLKILGENHQLKQTIEQKENMIAQLKRLAPTTFHQSTPTDPTSCGQIISGTPTTTTPSVNSQSLLMRVVSSCCGGNTVVDHPISRVEFTEDPTFHTNLYCESNELTVPKQTWLDDSVYSITAARSSPMHTRKLEPDHHLSHDMDLICSIADSYNLPDDSDTLSYISNCLNRQTKTSYSDSTSVLDRHRSAGTRKTSHGLSGSENMGVSMSASYNETVSDHRNNSRKHKRSASLGGANRPRGKAGKRSGKLPDTVLGQPTLL